MDADFGIIGGGIAGVSAAAELAALGSVVLWEREGHLAYHTSGRSAALYEPGYGAPPVVELTRASGPALRAAGVLSPRGMMLLAGTDEEAVFDRDMDGSMMERMTVAEAVAMVPVLNPAAVTRAAFSGAAEDIDTDRLIQGHARRVTGAGGRIVTGAEVTGIARDGAGWRVTAGGEERRVRILVNAAGAWADTVARMAGVAPLGIVPHRRSMARIPAPGARDVSGWPMLMGVGETWYAKPDAGALIVSPAEEHPMEPHDAWADDMVLAEGLARYEAMVTEPVTRMLANWAGLRSFAPDRSLVIGFDRQAAGFLWVAGQGGYGFQTSAAAARLAADLAGGRQSELSSGVVAALSPGRFG